MDDLLLKKCNNKQDATNRVSHDGIKIQAVLTLMNLLLTLADDPKHIYLTVVLVAAWIATNMLQKRLRGNFDVQKTLDLTNVILAVLPPTSCHSWTSLYE